MSKVRVQGKEYELRIDLRALKQFTKKNGGNIREAMAAMQSFDIDTIEEAFVIFANSAKHNNGEKEDVRPGCLEHATLREIADIADAIKQAQEESFHTETINGEADDEHHDDILEQIEAEEEKNGAAGEG